MKQLFRNIVISLFGNTFNAIINMFLIFYISRIYGIEFYGEFVIYQTSLMVCFILARINVWQSFVHRFFAVKNNKHVIKMYFGLDSFSAFISVVVSFPIFFFIYDALIALIICLYLVFNSNSFIVGLWRARNKFGLFATVLNLCASLKLILVLVIPFDTVYNFVIIFFLCDILIWFIFWLVEIIINRNILFSKFYYYIYAAKRLVKGGRDVRFIFGCYFSTLIDLPVSQLDKLILATFVSPYYIGVYSLIRKVCQLIATVTEPVTHVLYSEFNRLLAQQNISIVNFIAKVFTISIFVSGLVILFFVDKTFNYFDVEFLNNQLNGQKDLLLIGLAIQVIGLSFSWLNPLILAIGEVKKLNVIAIIANLFYLVFLYLGSMEFGIKAAFFALLIQYATVAILKYLVFVKFKKGDM